VSPSSCRCRPRWWSAIQADSRVENRCPYSNRSCREGSVRLATPLSVPRYLRTVKATGVSLVATRAEVTRIAPAEPAVCEVSVRVDSHSCYHVGRTPRFAALMKLASPESVLTPLPVKGVAVGWSGLGRADDNGLNVPPPIERVTNRRAWCLIAVTESRVRWDSGFDSAHQLLLQQRKGRRTEQRLGTAGRVIPSWCSWR